MCSNETNLIFIRYHGTCVECNYQIPSNILGKKYNIDFANYNNNELLNYKLEIEQKINNNTVLVESYKSELKQYNIGFDYYDFANSKLNLQDKLLLLIENKQKLNSINQEIINRNI
jgi:hypothetical protein